MPGRQITDHQMELYMTYRKTDRRTLAAAKAGFSRNLTDPGRFIVKRNPRLVIPHTLPDSLADEGGDEQQELFP